jgi:hypothetical protein
MEYLHKKIQAYWPGLNYYGIVVRDFLPGGITLFYVFGFAFARVY